MELSVVAVIDNRPFGKAMARLREYLHCIRQSGEGISTAALPFDILQVVFVSQAASHLRTVGARGDRLYQIEVGLPDGLSFKPTDDKALIPRLADQIVRAIEAAPIPSDAKRLTIERVRSCSLAA
jgi:hypothetical protein